VHALGELSLQVNAATFGACLGRAAVVAATPCESTAHFTIAVPDGHVQEWNEHHLVGSVERALAAVVGETTRVAFTVWGETPQSSWYIKSS
jgi:hypothetical protein